jgi:predicted membrane protein
MENVTFAVLLTAAGAGIAAGIVTALVSLIKTAIPMASAWNGALMAFAASLVLYIIAGFATNVATLDAALGVFLAWLTCGTAAVGIYEVGTKPIRNQIKADNP